MRLKDLFTVPSGQKVTEKAMRRVLISSICSILLCMTCLVSTTWAWFAVSLENSGNTIEIAEIISNISVKNDEVAIQPNDGVYSLGKGEYSITASIKLKQEEQASSNENLLDGQSHPPVYVVMIVKENENTSQCYYFKFTDRSASMTQQMTVNSDKVAVSFSVSWMKPGNADPVGGEPVAIGEAPTETPTETTTEAPTETTTEAPTETTTEAPTETTTEAPTETTTDPSTTETTTEASTETTTEASTETTTESSTTETTTQPTEPTQPTDPTQPTTEPTTEAPTETTTEAPTETTTEAPTETTTDPSTTETTTQPTTQPASEPAAESAEPTPSTEESSAPEN